MERLHQHAAVPRFHIHVAERPQGHATARAEGVHESFMFAQLGQFLLERPEEFRRNRLELKAGVILHAAAAIEPDVSLVGVTHIGSRELYSKLQELLDAHTLVLYESPYRIAKLLGELNEFFPEREVVLARELTKKFEEYLRGTPAELIEVLRKRSLKGEFVVMAG